MEDGSSEKHEFIDGEVYAMAGASFVHNQIVSNTQGEIFQFLRDKPCRIYGSDLKIHVKTASGFAYPDLSIICLGPEFMDNRKDIVMNPAVIIEVLSPDTYDYDHGKKFMLYRQISSLKEYILISSTDASVEKFIRNETESWTLTEYFNKDDVFTISTINYQTTLEAIYREVVFDAAPEPG